MVHRLILSACFLMLLAAAQVGLGQEFSADVAQTKSSNAELQKVYAGKDKIRFDVQGAGAAMGPTAVIFDEAQHKYTVIMPQRHIYMDAPAMIVRQIITQYWRVEDVNDACPQWKKTAEQAGTVKNWGSCTKVGSDSVNGRNAMKYEGVSNKGEKQFVWVDAKLHCVVKMEDTDRTIELRSIQEGAQPASLFEIPAGFTKMDMGAMMQQR